jgi:hypothetical protein
VLNIKLERPLAKLIKSCACKTNLSVTKKPTLQFHLPNTVQLVNKNGAPHDSCNPAAMLRHWAELLASESAPQPKLPSYEVHQGKAGSSLRAWIEKKFAAA